MADDLRPLIVEADSLCSLILHRESSGLSEQTRHELQDLVGKLRRVTGPRPSATERAAAERMRAQAQALMDRQDAGRLYPTGTWAQRWLPRVCKHDVVRCIHGDEIIARGFRRRLCMTCGRALRGRMPSVCWFTGTLHGLEHPEESTDA